MQTFYGPTLVDVGSCKWGTCLRGSFLEMTWDLPFLKCELRFVLSFHVNVIGNCAS